MFIGDCRSKWRAAGLWLLLLAAPHTAAAETACEQLASLSLPASTITSAVPVPAGGFAPPGQGAAQTAALYRSLPAFCRVAATLKPSPDSDIRIEVWLPATGWNGKFQAVGNGGWAGSMSYPGMARALAGGYATASTDTGHRGGRADFAIGHPERLVDFAYRAVHEMTVRAKSVTEARYGAPPKLSYWNGCSTGGRQGLKEAQQFPQDFDGIIAGAPANNWVNQKVAHIVVQQAFHRDPDADIPATKYPAIHKAVMQACDALDGVIDGVLEDPGACRFDPVVLACGGADSASCLTPRQVASARTLYSSIVHPRTGAQVFPGMVPGNELGWAVAAGPEPRRTQLDLLTYVTYADPKWDYRTFDFESGLALALTRDAEGGTTAAVDPDLRPYVGRGGKLLLYHGWGDTNIMASNTVNYHAQIVQALGGPEKAGESVRLFMVPGMEHCGGGAGTDTFDMMPVLERWVEQGVAPERIPASRVRNGVVERTRPLCHYPQVARYTGTGSTDDTANFVCAAPAGAR
jgi:feruloyl esterase